MTDKPTVLDVLDQMRADAGAEFGMTADYVRTWADRIELAWRRELWATASRLTPPDER